MKKKNVLILSAVVIAIVSFFLTKQLAPWFYAINTSVRLKLDAPAESNINICWDEEQKECVPLVPYSEENTQKVDSGKTTSLWLGELPPRPDYYISIIFISKVHNAIFHELELDSTNIQILGKLPEAGIGSMRFNTDQFIYNEKITRSLNDSNMISSYQNGIMSLTNKISPILNAPIIFGKTEVLIYLFLLINFAILLLICYLLPRSLSNHTNPIIQVNSRRYPWWVFFFCCLFAGLQIFIIANSSVLINNADPIGYLTLAMGGGWFNISRLPGYPLFLKIALWISDYCLNGVTISQSFVLILSVFISTWALRKWLHPLAAVLFVLFCLFSPAQVHWVRWILRDSVFSSLSILGVTSVIAHFTSQKDVEKKIWLLIYAIICGVALLFRENGIIFPIAMVPVLAIDIIGQKNEERVILSRLRSFLKKYFQYTLPILTIMLVYFGFGIYNYLHYGYFNIVEQQLSHHYLSRLIFSSNFDSRGLLNQGTLIDDNIKPYLGWPIYSSFIVSRYQNPDSDPMYATLAPSVAYVAAESGNSLNYFNIAYILDEIGKNSLRLIPWQADIAGLLRSYYVTIFMNNDSYAYHLVPDDTIMLSEKQAWLSKISPKLNIEGTQKDQKGLITKYYDITSDYQWFGILFVFALFVSLYIYIYCDPVFLTPIALFLTNLFVLVITRFVQARYFVVLDVLLILQIALGFSLWLKNSSDKLRMTTTKNN